VNDRVILALDVPDAESADRLVTQVGEKLQFVKIGLQLFIAEGPDIIRRMKGHGLRVFLDLKLHDIPNTVRSAVGSAARQGVDLLTIHLAGGPEMIKAAAEEASLHPQQPLILGVTVLTSTDTATLKTLGIHQEPADRVSMLAKMAGDCGLSGVIASPQEIVRLRKENGSQLTIITPGVRPAGADIGDQKRIATPSQAIRDGANYLVIGRPISAAPDPAQAFDAIVEEISSVH